MLEYVSRYIVMPNHANPNGLVFGGILLSWIDMTAAMVAEKYSGKDVATVHLEQVHFQAPIKVGEHVKVTARLVDVGNTSMKIEVVVESENFKSSILKKTTKAMLTFVALDKDMKPTSVR